MERSHPTGDVYLPLLITLGDERELLRRAAQLLYYYNGERPPTGKGMDGFSPWRKLGN